MHVQHQRPGTPYEMKEKMDLDLEDFQLFSVMEFIDRVEYTFWKKANLDIEKINLHEGQQIRWFTESEARNTKLAYGFNEIVDDFFKKTSFLPPIND